MTNASNELGILTVSCDKYQDLWKPFFKLFFQYWPDCPYPVYLISNNITYKHERVLPIQVGDDGGWSISMRKGLTAFPHESAIVILEDFFFCQPINSSTIKDLVGFFLKNQLGYLRLEPEPPAKRAVPEMPSIGYIEKGARYRTALQIAIWKKTVLKNLLVDHESAWDFEWVGSKRSDLLPDSFMSVIAGERPIPKLHAVVLGKWDRKVLKKLNEMKIDLDISKRAIENKLSRWWRLSPIHVMLAMLKKRLLREY